MHTINHIRAVDAAKTSSQKSRLAKVQAAAADPARKAAFAIAVRGLQRLGFEIEQIAASGNVAELDRKMSDMKWTSLERVTLKTNLATCGAID
jgi:hypothetical protein